MIDLQAILLAILTGLGFGFIIVMMGSTWQRLAIILILLYILQTGSLQLWRIIEGKGSVDELVIVTIYRLAFSAAACLIVAIVPHLSSYRSNPRR